MRRYLPRILAAPLSQRACSIFNSVKKTVPARPTPIHRVARDLPDAVLEELENGLRHFLTQHPEHFVVESLPGAAVTVCLAPPLIDPSLRAAALHRVAQLEDCEIGELRASLGSVAASVENFVDLAAALKSDSAFVVRKTKSKKVMVSLSPEARAMFIQQRRERVQGIPSFFIDVDSLTEAEAFQRLNSDTEAFEVVADPLSNPRLYYARVRSGFHTSVDDAVDARYAELRCEDFDAFRLARYLSCDTSSPLATVVDTAQAALARPVLQVVLSFPELFRYSDDGVRFLLPECHRPSSFSQYTDDELRERIAALREAQREVRRQRRQVDFKSKERLNKYNMALVVRTNPAGNPFMHPDVLAMLLFDVLPDHGPINMSQLATFLPESAMTHGHLLNPAYYLGFQHLFYVFQERPPEYLIQRADLPRSDDNFDDAHDATTVAQKLFDFAVERQLQRDRRTYVSTMRHVAPLQLRRKVESVGGWTAVLAARPDLFNLLGGENRSVCFTFSGAEAEKHLPPPSGKDPDVQPESDSDSLSLYPIE